ncbi:MAG TPA: HRDC domain-containing protein [Bacillota bacterium]|nr:HRDC domain-containing protein [Bacillota bacterium]
MLHHIVYLITLDHPTAGMAKILIYEREGTFQTLWTRITDQQEDTEIVYSGPNIEQAWRMLEQIRQVRCNEGYSLTNPLLMITSLTALPHSYLFLRKLECFSDRHKDDTLFQELRKWRRSLATSLKIPPYYIATDKLLHLISTFVPHQPEELMQIPGIGRNKLDQYGTAILERTKNYSQIYSYPLDWVGNRISDEELSSWLLDQNLLKHEKKKTQEKKEQEERLRLLEAIHEDLSIEEMCERLSLSNSNLMKRFHQLAKEGYEILPYLQKQIEGYHEKNRIEDLAATLGNSRLKPIFEQMYGTGEELQDKEKGKKYNIIRLVCTYLQLKAAS